MSKPNPFRLARSASDVLESYLPPHVGPELVLVPTRATVPARVDPPAPRREKRPVVDLETIRVLLYLSTSPRLTRAHRDACRQAAELLR